MKKVDISLILPVHNQEKIINPVLNDILKIINKEKITYEILLIENGSKDKTFQKIKSLQKPGKIIAFSTKQGYGSAIIYGIKKSKGKSICYMPSDGQVDFKIFRKLWKKHKLTNTHIVKIKRKDRESLNRYILSRLFSILLHYLYGTPTVDVNGSPRIIKSKYLKELDLKQTDSFIDAEMLIKAKKKNYSIEEVEMDNLNRAGGKSSRNFKTYIEFAKNIIYYKFHSFK